MINQLGKREILIVKHLINAKKPLSSDVLGVILGASPKTIRGSMDYVGEILKIAGGAKIISKTGSGYSIEVFDDNEYRVFMQTFNAKYLDAYWIPTNISTRVTYIIRRLLMVDAHLKMEQLMDELFISRVTLTKDLKEVRKTLKSYHLKLEHRAKYGLKINGRESHYRVAFVDYLDADEDSNSIEYNADQILYMRDPSEINEVVISCLMSNHISISTNSLRKLIKLIIVSEYRISKKQHMIFSAPELVNLTSKREYESAYEICQRLNLNWDTTEISFLAVFIISRRNIMKSEPFSVHQEALYLSYSTDIIKHLKCNLSTDLSLYEGFEYELAKHIRGMTYRIKYGLEKRDVGILESKGSNPAFEYAVIASDWLSKTLNMEIQETEIAFLSYRFYMHFRFMSFQRKSNILVVLSNGKNAADLFIHELQSNFGKFIDKVHASEFYELPYLSLLNYDCILTDIPAIQFNVNIPVWRVNYFFNENDLQKLKRFFMHSQINSEHFLRCFDETLFFMDQEFESKEQLIGFMFAAIKEKYPLDENALENILRREGLSSSEKGNSVAIPHTLFASSEFPIIAVCVLKRPLLWDKEYCQLILMVVNGRNEDAPFMSLSIAKAATSNIQFVYDMIKADSYDKKIEIIGNFVDRFEFD
ncbi:BglG family transcription antiterminator [Fusibacter bizertensis]